VRKADNLTAIYEPIVQKMWDPQRLPNLYASTGCRVTALPFRSQWVNLSACASSAGSTEHGHHHCQQSIDFSRIDMDELTCGGEPIMMQEDEALVDGSELDQYLPPGGQQSHYLYPSSFPPSHPLWAIHKPPSEEPASATQESNNSHAKHIKRCNETAHTAVEYYSTPDDLSVPPPPSLRYHELQPSSGLIKTERDVYHQGVPTTVSSSTPPPPPPALSYHQSFPLVPAPNYYSAGTGNSAMSASHGQYLQSLPSYQQYFQQRGTAVFGNSGDSAAWSNYSYL
jgi:hypothetical protein